MTGFKMETPPFIFIFCIGPPLIKKKRWNSLFSENNSPERYFFRHQIGWKIMSILDDANLIFKSVGPPQPRCVKQQGTDYHKIIKATEQVFLLRTFSYLLHIFFPSNNTVRLCRLLKWVFNSIAVCCSDGIGVAGNGNMPPIPRVQTCFEAL